MNDKERKLYELDLSLKQLDKDIESIGKKSIELLETLRQLHKDKHEVLKQLKEIGE
jgi:hypothetical protein